MFLASPVFIRQCSVKKHLHLKKSYTQYIFGVVFDLCTLVKNVITKEKKVGKSKRAVLTCTKLFCPIHACSKPKGSEPDRPAEV